MIRFFLMAFLFAGVFFNSSSLMANPPGLCKNLFTDKNFQVPLGPLARERDIYDYSQDSMKLSLHLGILKLGALAGGEYSIMASSLAKYIVNKFAANYEKIPHLHEFVRNLLIDLIYNPQWDKPKAQLSLQTLEYISTNCTFIRTKDGQRVLHLITRTLITGTPNAQKDLTKRLDAINEGTLKHNDFDDL